MDIDFNLNLATQDIVDDKINTHSTQKIIDAGGVHGIQIVDDTTPKIKFKKEDGTWGEISGESATMSDQDIADIKAAFDAGLNGTNNSNSNP